jgi:hypothetical protein
MVLSHPFKVIVVFILVLISINCAGAAIIYQSATMGPTGQNNSVYAIDSSNFLGSRFYVGTQAQVTAIGGHMFAGLPEDDIFGAIIRLNDSTDLPKGLPLDSFEVVAYTLFTPDYPDSDFRVPLSVTLEPGYYALVFGSGLYGTTGTAYMPTDGQTDMTGASYFYWDGYYDFVWYDAKPFQGRFVVEGTVVAPTDYCAASAARDEYISGVQVGSINNTTSYTTGGYASYTNMTTTMEIGKSYPITVTNGYPYSPDRCGIWVDWNQDMDFDDAGETITVSGNPGFGPYTAMITPPADAVPGNTRLRVRIVWNETPSPCGASAWGETEDYTINVVNTVPTTLNISGYIKTAQGVIIKGVNVSASTGQSTVTDALGKYSLTLPSPFTGTVSPTSTDWTYDARLYTNQTTSLADQDFIVTYNVTYGGGSGTSSDPYLIYNAAQLNGIGARAGDWGKCFKVMANIDLSGYDGIAGRPSFNRIGVFSNLPFTGIFDGNNCTISNFKLDSNAGNDGVGMFGCMDSGTSQIKNVKLTNVDVNSTSIYGTGAIVGWMTNGAISGCSVQNGTVSGGNEVGGLIGMCWDGIISGCSAGVNVTGKDNVGGILGETGAMVTMTDCRASCNVAGQSKCGGLIGEIGDAAGSVTASSASGGVTVTVGLGGGLVGSNSGTMNQCYSTAAVSAVSGFVAGEIGGLAGRNMGNISNSCAMGSASGLYPYPTGGLIGFNWKAPSSPGTVTNCYSTCASNGGGLIGLNTDGIITGSFWDINTSGTIVSAGGTGKTTEQMQTKSTFTNAGWDFNDIWRICEPANYPRLIRQTLPGDIVCADGVDIEDIAMLCDQWLLDVIPADLAPAGGDGIVNFADFVIFAGQWNITADTNDLLVFAEQWLKTGQSSCSADISHDGQVDFDDFALLAGNWLKGF